MQDKINEVLTILEEAAKGEGAFNRDPIVHAENTIDNMKALIGEAIAKLKEIKD